MVQLFYGLMNQTAIVRMTLASAFVSPGMVRHVSGFRRRAKTNGLSPCQIGQGESNLLRCIALDVPFSGGPPTTVSARVIRPIVAAPVSRIRVSTCRKSELQAAWIYPLR